MKRIIIMIGLMVSLLLFNSHISQAEEVDLFDNNARSSILIEQSTGKVLYENNAHDELPPASMTKIMTLLLVMEAINEKQLSWDEEITVSEHASSMGGSQVFLEAGEKMTVDELVKAVAVASANDASVALAERIAGSEKAFVALMNEKAKQLQLQHTHFENASGLPTKNHYSSAYDMAMMSKQLLKNEKITEYTSIYEDYLRKGEENEFWLVNTNKLVRFYPEVDGLKTGYTSEAKYCLAATAMKDDMRVIAVVMGVDSIKNRNKMTMEMIHHAFSHYEIEKLFTQGEPLTKIKNMRTEDALYDVVTSEPINILHRKGEKDTFVPTIDVRIKDGYQLPIKKGEKVGHVTISNEKETIFESPLILTKDMDKASFTTLLKRTFRQLMTLQSSGK